MIPIQPQTFTTIFGTPTKTRFAMAGIGLVVISLAVGMAPNTSNKVDPRDANWQVAIDPHKVIGYQSCENLEANSAPRNVLNPASKAGSSADSQQAWHQRLQKRIQLHPMSLYDGPSRQPS